MSPEYNEVLNEIIKGLVVIVVPVLLRIVHRLILKLEAWVESKTTNEVLKRIEHEAFEVVAAMEQAVAGPVKEAAADGKLSDEERQRIKRAALDTLRDRLKGLPAQFLPDFEKRLSDSLEAAVCKIGLVALPQNPPPAPGSK